MISDRLMNAILILSVTLAMWGLVVVTLCHGAARPAFGDRAVEIAKQSRDRIEASGNMLKASSGEMFSEFAVRTGELQKLLDTRERLDQAGMLDKDDPMGRARRSNINARVITEVGKLKQVCDNNLDKLLMSLDAFDRAIADSIVDTQSTRSMNSNYELILKNYKASEMKRFDVAAATAETLLEEMRATSDPAVKERLAKKFDRVKRRIKQIRQRRLLYESRLKVAAMNQKISDRVRDKIRSQGNDVPAKFRTVMSNLYTAFYKIIPVAETGGTGFVDSLADFGFGGMKELSETLNIVEASTEKLDKVLDRMVNDVMGGLDDIQVIDDVAVKSGAISYEREIEFLSKERAAWDKG